MATLQPIEITYRIAAASTLKETATDSDASKFTALYPTLKGDGSLVKAGTRINRGGKLYRARVDLWDNSKNAPENSPDLWEEIMYKDGYRIITIITSENPFMRGERGWYEDKLYESVIDNNVWTPKSYPDGWKFIKEAKV
jgi:hypothetical protein